MHLSWKFTDPNRLLNLPIHVRFLFQLSFSSVLGCLYSGASFQLLKLDTRYIG